MKKKQISAVFLVAASLATASQVFAQENTQTHNNTIRGGRQGNFEKMARGGRHMIGRPAVVGTVTAINGNSITVTEKNHENETGTTATTKTFTVDVSKATVMKNNATTTPSSIAIDDTLFVLGAVNGTTVTATMIHDGNFVKGGRGMGSYSESMMMNTGGNGQPIVAGSVTAINGNSITITNKSNITYTIDASKAAITKNNTTSSLQNVTLGDMIVVQGAVNGTSVTAATIMDNGVMKARALYQNTNEKAHSRS